jgi:antitoxin component YwqK of YwqJK toxin-antitoxin module
MYYKSRQLWMEMNYKNGKREGISKGYYESGEYRYKDTYKDGKKINRKAYTARGKLKFNQDYPQ